MNKETDSVKFVFNHTLHKKLWKYLADNPGATKHNAVVYLQGLDPTIEFIINGCLACKAATRIGLLGKIYLFCDECPLEWFDDKGNLVEEITPGESLCCRQGTSFSNWRQKNDIYWVRNRKKNERHDCFALELVSKARRVMNATLSQVGKDFYEVI